MCGGDNCGIDVYVEDGKIVTVKGMREHPVNRGALCPQARAAIEQVYHPERLRHPLRRRGDSWERISWDEALDTIAAHLTRIKAQHGAQALAVYQGRALLQFIKDGWTRRFMNLYGTPNFVRNDHMCAYPNAIGEQLTYGTPSAYYSFDGERSRCILLWGSNPLTSHLSTTWPHVVEAQKRGAKLLVVDPRRTRAAARADVHAQLRPGTDAALALGMLHVIIRDELYDADFVERWTVGFEALAERVRAYPPAKMAAITGVPAETIVALAETYATHGPSFLDAGNALEHQSNAIHAIRTIMIMRAITGNLDVPGGNLLAKVPRLTDTTLSHKLPPGLQPLGARRYPLFIELTGFIPGDVFVDTLLTGDPYPVRAFIAGGGNPMLTWPSTQQLHTALDRLELMVVMDLYMTPTAAQADIVLPMADPFERTQLITRSGYMGPDKPYGYVMLRKRILDPGDRRSDWWFWHHLGRRMGYEEYFHWATAAEAIDYQLRPLNLTCADLLERHPEGVYYGPQVSYRKYERDGFRTPSGKVELYSHVLESFGYDPLPAYEEPLESPVSTPDLAREYPLVLDAGRREAVYTHSRHRNLDSMRKRVPEPTAELHPTTAAAYGVIDGDRVVVESPRGAIALSADVTETVVPGTVSLLHGWAEANVNELTDYTQCDAVLSCPSVRAGLCRIRKAKEA
jgi:anaerobic selenocysteine-containing dehydrogenase